MKHEKAQEETSIVGKNIVITGTLPQARSQVEQLILSCGGQVQNGVNQKTHFLLKGEGGFSTKEKKAEALNVPILDWPAFQKKLNH